MERDVPFEEVYVAAADCDDAAADINAALAAGRDQRRGITTLTLATSSRTLY